MTAPLPAAASALSAIAPMPRHHPKAAKAEDFTLPDSVPDALPHESANQPAEITDDIAADNTGPDGPAMAVPIPLPQPAPISVQSLAGQLTPPPANPESATEPANVSPATVTSAVSSQDTIALEPQGEPVAATNSEAELAAATAAPTISIRTPSQASTLPVIKASPEEASAPPPPPSQQTPPVDPKPQPSPLLRAANAPPAAIATAIAEAPAESGDQPTGRDQRGSSRSASSPSLKAESASPIAPFRIEAAAAPAQASVTAAVIQAATVPSARPALVSPDLAADAPSHTPDVVVELVGGEALDLTISAATPDSLERLSAAEPELRLELAQLGAEVEAIRMELRAPAGSEEARPDRASQAQEKGADTAQTAQSNDHGRQGDRMMRQTEMRDTVQGRLAIGRTLRLTADAEASARDAIAGNGRVDRYA